MYIEGPPYGIRGYLSATKKSPLADPNSQGAGAGAISRPCHGVVRLDLDWPRQAVGQPVFRLS